MLRLGLLCSLLSLTACLSDVPEDVPDDRDGDTADTDAIIDAGGKKQLAYVVIPHPDDEFEAWSLVERSSDNYTVFVLMTHGEETSGCRVPSEGGADWYQGPGSKVGQPDLGELVYGNPWQGRWNPACDAARLASFHLFLDRMAQKDPTLPQNPPYRGRVCFPGKTGDGIAPGRLDNGVRHASSCADVYASSRGARVIFDLGDTDLTSAEVLWAINAVRTNRASLGIPDLPEHEVLGAAFYNATAPNSGVAQYPACDYYGHPDHHAIHVALWTTHLGAGPQLVRTCDADPDVANTGGRIAYVSSANQDAAFAVEPSTGRRLGASTVAYGWLNPTYYATCASGCGFSRKQSFWKK